MSKKENFNKAMYDMFGVGNDPEAVPAEEAPAEAPAAEAEAPAAEEAPAEEAAAPAETPAEYLAKFL